MKTFLYIILILLALSEAAYVGFNANTGRLDLLTVFVCGALFGVCLIALKLNFKNAKLNSYKRELEKESIAADESSSKVKVLEQKIEVLEKALDNAIKNNK